MTQRNFDPNYQPNESTEKPDDSPSLPPREKSAADERLIRPDRQFTYWGLPPDQWPAPVLNGHSLTVDRLQADLNGPPHRFLICIGDDVEIRIDSTVVFTGCVARLYHLTQEAHVALRGLGLRWVSKESIYPAVPTAMTEVDCVNPLDPTRQKRQLARSDSEPGLMSIRPVLTAFTVHEFMGLCMAMTKGELSYVDYQSGFARLVESREALIEELKECFTASQLARLATGLGTANAKRATKDINAVSIYRAWLTVFVLDDTFECADTESFEEAVAKKVRATTSTEHFEYYWRKSIESGDRD